MESHEAKKRNIRALSQEELIAFFEEILIIHFEFKTILKFHFHFVLLVFQILVQIHYCVLEKSARYM